MSRLCLSFLLLLLVVALVRCTDEQPIPSEPPAFTTLTSTGTITGQVLGPDGSICNSVPDGSTLRIDAIDPENATSEIPLAGQDWFDCPAANSYSMSVGAGTYALRVQLPRHSGIGNLPWRWLEPSEVVVTSGPVEKDIQVFLGTPLGGSATRDGFPLQGAWLTLAYDFETSTRFDAARGASGPDGTWGDREATRSDLPVQDGLSYKTACPPAWPRSRRPDDVGYRLLAEAPEEAFLFSSEVDAIDCTYESISDVPGLGVTENGYQLVLRPASDSPQIGTGFFRDGVAADAVMFGGGVAYTTDPEHTFVLYDPRGTTDGNLIGTGLPVEVIVPGDFADHQTLTVIRERPEDSYWNARALDLLVVRETYAWESEPDYDYVIFKYTLFNPTLDAVGGITAGQVLDHDLTSYTNYHVDHNYVEYDSGNDVVMISEPWYELWAGHATLGFSPTSYRSWANPSLPQPGDASRIDPSDLAAWHDYLTGGIPSPEEYGPTDIRHLLGVGPGTLEPGSSGAFFTVLAGGHDRDDVLSNVVAARARFDALPAAAKAPYPVLHVVVGVSKIKPRKDHFEATFTFPHPSIARSFDPSATFCSGAPADGFKRMGSDIAADFPKDGLDSWLDDGDRVVCMGKLVDGRLFGGADVARIE